MGMPAPLSIILVVCLGVLSCMLTRPSTSRLAYVRITSDGHPQALFAAAIPFAGYAPLLPVL